MPLRTIASKAPQIITHYGQRFADDLIDPRFLLRKKCFLGKEG